MSNVLSVSNVLIESDQVVWDGRFKLKLVKFRQRRFDGAMSGVRTWEVLMRGKAAAVLPYDPVLDMVVTIEQFRLPAYEAGIDPVLVELAAGLCDAGETPEVTIRRESQEEMGMAVEELIRVGDFLLTPGGSDEMCTIFAGRVRLGAIGADGLLGEHGLASEHEDIRVRALPADVVIARALAGEYPNAVASLGLLWFASRRQWLREKWT